MLRIHPKSTKFAQNRSRTEIDKNFQCALHWKISVTLFCFFLYFRQKEVAECLHEPLCNYAAKDVDKFLTSNVLTLFLGALINSCPEGNVPCSKLLEKLAKKLAQPFTIGMTSLLTHTVAHSTRPSYRPKVIDNSLPGCLGIIVTCTCTVLLYFCCNKRQIWLFL